MEEILKEISNSIISQLGLGGLIVVIIVILLIRYLHQKLRADIFKEIYSITNKKDDDKELKKINPISLKKIIVNWIIHF